MLLARRRALYDDDLLKGKKEADGDGSAVDEAIHRVSSVLAAWGVVKAVPKATCGAVAKVLRMYELCNL